MVFSYGYPNTTIRTEVTTLQEVTRFLEKFS